MLRRPASLLILFVGLSALPARANKPEGKRPANQNETIQMVRQAGGEEEAITYGDLGGGGLIDPNQGVNPKQGAPKESDPNKGDPLQTPPTVKENPGLDEEPKKEGEVTAPGFREPQPPEPSDGGGGSIPSNPGRLGSGGGAGPEPPPQSQTPPSGPSAESSWGAMVGRSSFRDPSAGGLEFGSGRPRQLGSGFQEAGGEYGPGYAGNAGGRYGGGSFAGGSYAGGAGLAGQGARGGGAGAQEASVMGTGGFRLGSKVDLAALGRDFKDRIYGGGPSVKAPVGRRVDSREAALAEWERAVQRSPNDPFALTRRGESYYAFKRYDLALADSGRAVRADRRNAAAWRLAAMAYYKLGDMDRALRSADEAIRLKPTDAMGYLVRAYLRQAAGDLDGALADLEAAALLDPRYAAILERAKAGKGVIDPYDASTLGAELKVRPSRLAPIAGLIAAAAALAALVALGGWGLGRRTRKSAFAAKYTIERKLGQGGMGEVYLATDRQLHRQVAVKKISDSFLRSNSSARRLFLREARTAAAAHHPGIVEVYEVIEDRKDVYLVFELVEGRTVRDLLREGGPLSLAEASRVLKKLGEALDFAHGSGLVHRDLKPANVMISEHGRVKVMDFGIARSLHDHATPLRGEEKPGHEPGMTAAQTHAAGTRPYMAPEAFDGLVLRQGDVYALGVMAYELITGRLPERGESGAPTRAALADPALTPLASRALARAMAPRPEDRQPSAGRFAEELAAAGA